VQRGIGEKERLADSLAKYELLKKSMNEKGMDVAVRFLLRKQIILDPHAEVTDEIERNLLFYQVSFFLPLKSGFLIILLIF